jgi:transcriptional regulator with XRE-family HTH domain
MTPLEIRQRIGQNAKVLRKQRGFSQSELAGRAGVRKDTVSRFERTGAASLDTVTRLAWALSAEGELVDLFTNPWELPSDLVESIRAQMLENPDPRGPTYDAIPPLFDPETD